MIYKYETTIKDTDIDYILSAAFTGCVYWADKAEIRKNKKKGDPGDIYVSEALTRGYSIRIHDEEQEKWHVLTMKKFLKGMSLIGRFDIDNYNSLDADRILQLALFGEQVYS